VSELATDLRTLRFWRWFATSVFLFIGVVASLAQLAQLAAPKLLERYGGWIIGLFPIEGVGPDFAVVGASVRG